MYQPVLATQPCTLASTTGYRVYRPGTGYTAFVQLTHPQLVTESSDLVHSTLGLILGQVDSQYLQDMASTHWLQSLPTGQTACFTLTGYRACLLPTSTKNHQPRSSTRCPLLISSQFTGLRLMTGLIDSQYLQDMASTHWLQSLPTGQTACFTLTGYRACLLPTSTKNHQPRSSTRCPLLISSQFTGLRLMTGLIMYSP